MLKRVLKKEKPRVFLGVLAVVPRTDLKRHLDEKGVFEDADLDSALRQSLIEILSLTPVQNVEFPLANDLVLDVIISEFQSGDVWDMSLGNVSFPIFWRPKVTVASRLYSLTTKKTKATYAVTEKMTWGQYLSRIISLRVFFGFRPMFNQKDIEYLLYQACTKLLVKMQKSI